MGTIEKTNFLDLTLAYLFEKFTKDTFVEKKQQQQTVISD